jgi:hypothetical protein
MCWLRIVNGFFIDALQLRSYSPAMIEILESRIAPATFTVLNTDDSGAGSLRQAILDANAAAGADFINFDIPGNFLHTIKPLTFLPAITGAVTMNGYTQDGSIPNTAPVGTNAVINIALDGINLDGSNGLRVDASNVTIRGLAIFGFTDDQGFDGSGIFLADGDNILITGCFLGTPTSGVTASPNEEGGINMSTTVTNVTIGGDFLGDRNLISGNSGSGITMRGTNVVVQGNLIGVARDGITPLPNSNGISGGFITGATIGGSGTEMNVIAYNNNVGIGLFSDECSGVEILPNSIYRNGALGIDLDFDGVTVNDPFDVDAGPNGFQNFPIITNVTTTGITTVFYTLNSSPNTPVRIDFYTSSEPDASGFGEGRTFLSSVIGLTDALGHLENSVLFLDSLPIGTTLTATATNTVTNNTSEFSRGFNVNAVEIVNDKTATWTDGDGDRVTLKITKGTLTPENFNFGKGAQLDGALLKLLQLTDAGFQGTDVTFSVKKMPGGDGRVAVGFLDATGRDLGKVTVPGDLGRIICGDADTTGLSLSKLKVQSFGVAGTQTLPDGVNSSSITGSVGSIQIASDLRDATITIRPFMFTAEELGRLHIDTFKVGGDILSDRVIFGSQFQTFGSIKNLTVGGSLLGGQSGGGSVRVDLNVGKVTTGSVINGSVSVGTLATDVGRGKVMIKGNIIGGNVSLGKSVDQLSVLGSVTGDGSSSGRISSSGDLASVFVKGDLIGAHAGFNENLSSTGVISALGSIARVNIGGSIIGGSADSGGSITRSGMINAGKSLGSVIVGGDAIGSIDSPVIISAVGQPVKPTEGFDVAIKSVTIKGSAVNTRILAGFDTNQNPANADACIGTVKIGKNWVSSSIAAGVQDAGNPGFGSGDILQAVGDTALIARIASINIRGAMLPGIDSETYFGFVAQEIVKLQIGSYRAPLTAGPSNSFNFLGAFPNLRYFEV